MRQGYEIVVSLSEADKNIEFFSKEALNLKYEVLGKAREIQKHMMVLNTMQQ